MGRSDGGVTAVDELCETVARRRPRRAGRGPHALGGGRPPPSGPDVVHVPRPPASSPTTPPTSPSRSARARPAPSWPTCWEPRARSARSIRATGDATVGGVLATGLSGHRRLRLRPAARPGARSAVRHRRRPAREGGRPDGEERERLRPPAPAGRFARHHRRARAGHAALPARARRRRSGSRPTPIRSRRAARCTGRRASRGTAARRTCSSRGSRPTSTPSAAALEAPRGAQRGAGVARRAPPGADLGAPVGAGARSRPTSTPPACAGWRRSASARCTSPPTTSAPWPWPRAAATGAGGWLLREAGAPGLDGFGIAAAQRPAGGARPRRVRSRRQVLARSCRARMVTAAR